MININHLDIPKPRSPVRRYNDITKPILDLNKFNLSSLNFLKECWWKKTKLPHEFDNNIIF